MGSAEYLEPWRLFRIEFSVEYEDPFLVTHLRGSDVKFRGQAGRRRTLPILGISLGTDAGNSIN